MLSSKEQRIQEHRKFMESKATAYLKPLMVDILKEKPEDILDYIAVWCQTKGKEIKRQLNGGKDDPKPEPQPSLKNVEQVVAESHETPADAPVRPPSQANLPPSPPTEPHRVSETECAPKLPSQVDAFEAVEVPAPAAPEQPTKKPHNADLPSSDDEDEADLEEDTDRLAKLEAKKSIHKKKMGISAEAYGNYNQLADFKAPFIEKTDEQLVQIRKTLALSFMFKNLDQKDLESVIGAMAVNVFGDGEFVIKQGDDGAQLFIVGEGQLKCEKLFPGKDAPTYLKTYQPGEVFGELSLMYNAPRAASIISEGPSVCFSLDRDTFNNIVKGAAIKRRNVYEEFLAKIDILTDLEPYERSKICDCLNTETYSQGEFVIREGEEGLKFYLVQEGSAEAIKEIDGEQVKVFEYGPNTYFGELALLNNDKRKASIRVTSEKLIVASLDKNSFKRMLGPIEAILQRNSEKYAKYAEHIDKQE